MKAIDFNIRLFIKILIFVDFIFPYVIIEIGLIFEVQNI